jgi:hypothetical protein
MPSKTLKQHAYMAMAANPKSRKKMKNPPPEDVAEDFIKADKGKTFPKKKGK